MSSAFKKKLVLSFAVLLITSVCLYFVISGSEYFIACLVFIYLTIIIHYYQLTNSSKYSEFIENKRVYLRYVGIIFIGCLYFLWPSEYDQMMSAALKIRDTHPEQKVFDGEVEPPMPNKTENNKTMTGIDSNNNGIRDDVDIWINRTASSYNERMAYRQYSRAMTKSFDVCSKKDEKNVEIVFSKVRSAQTCFSHLNYDYSRIAGIHINTSKRESCLDFFKIVGSDRGDHEVNLKNGSGLAAWCIFNIRK